MVKTKNNRGIAHILIVVIIGILIASGVGLYLYKNKDSSKKVSTSLEKIIKPSGKKVSIPQKILDNKFGFPSGGPGDVDIYTDFGIGWVRPHPGPFQWGEMQSSKESEINFSTTDRYLHLGSR